MAVKDKVIASDATIRDILEGLNKPHDYVRVVLENMTQCWREHANASVRVGVTGKGKTPHHKITYPTPEGDEVHFACFDGRNRFKDQKTPDSAWSSVTMSRSDVMVLMGELNGWKGARPNVT
jgi:hypothetical protein